jgi:acetamidase/formamidase
MLTAALLAGLLAQNVVRYEPAERDLKYTFGIAEPVARVKPGDVIDTKTFDCFVNKIKKPGDTLSMVPGDNPLTGPFYVEGAEPGDTLAVKILQLDVDGNQGVGALAPGFGALNTTNYTPMLHAPVPEKIWFYPIDRANNEATFTALDSNFSVRIPLHPFLGCLGVAPALESRSSVTPAEHGGNMDAPEASAGNTAYFPVNVKGALLYLGDGHAAMGDGEIAGTAIEVPMHARLQVDVIKGQKIGWPRFENASQLMAVGAYRPLDDALRIAFTELIGWITSETTMTPLDAYQLLSQVGRVHVTEMVDPNYVVIAAIDKKYLPPRKNGKAW